MWQHLENTKQMLFQATIFDDEMEDDRYLFSENPVVHLTQPSTANGWWKILGANPRGCFNPWRRWADGVAHSARANCCSTRRFCWRRHLELAHVKCSHPRRAFGLIWRCAALVGRIHPLKVRKRIQKGHFLRSGPFQTFGGAGDLNPVQNYYILGTTCLVTLYIRQHAAERHATH